MRLFVPVAVATAIAHFLFARYARPPPPQLSLAPVPLLSHHSRLVRLCHLPLTTATCHMALTSLISVACNAHSGAQLANKFFERLLFWASVDILMNAHESAVRLCRRSLVVLR